MKTSIEQLDKLFMKLLRVVLIGIDKILNPKASDYPFLWCDEVRGQEIYDYSCLKRCLIIRKFNEGNKHCIWCIRWL